MSQKDARLPLVSPPPRPQSPQSRQSCKGLFRLAAVLLLQTAQTYAVSERTREVDHCEVEDAPVLALAGPAAESVMTNPRVKRQRRSSSISIASKVFMRRCMSATDRASSLEAEGCEGPRGCWWWWIFFICVLSSATRRFFRASCSAESAAVSASSA